MREMCTLYSVQVHCISADFIWQIFSVGQPCKDPMINYKEFFFKRFFFAAKKIKILFGVWKLDSFAPYILVCFVACPLLLVQVRSGVKWNSGSLHAG
jgi:hypothetical protein